MIKGNTFDKYYEIEDESQRNSGNYNNLKFK